MRTGSKSEKRPAETVGCAVLAVRIVVGDVGEPSLSSSRAAASSAGGAARAKKLSEVERKKIAEKAARERWK